MSRVAPIPTDAPARDEPPLAVLLGLRQQDTGEWLQRCSTRFARPENFRWYHALIHFGAAGLTAWLYRPFVADWILVGWAGLIGLAVVAAGISHVRVQQLLAANDYRGILWWQALTGAATGSAWGAGFVLFALSNPRVELSMLGIMAICVVLAAARMLARLPLAGIALATPVALGAAIGLAVTGRYGVAIGSLWMLVNVASLIIAIALVHYEAWQAEVAAGDKQQVVSLLLNEDEDERADWLWQLDSQRRVRNPSARFAYALGRERGEVEGEAFVRLMAGDDWDSGNFSRSLHDLADRLQRRERFTDLLVKVSIGSKTRWWELSGAPLLSDDGDFLGFRGVGSDVTDQRESSEKIAYMARYDALTGLPNRLLLNETLCEAIQHSQQWRSRCAFMMIDLDRFKAVNDSLGHHIGDHLLAQVAGRLNGLMAPGEVCGRLGGDEFGIVLRDGSDRRRLDELAGQVIETLSQPYTVDGHPLYVGASVGSAIGPRDGSTVEELMRSADLALYRAKGEGGNAHHAFQPQFHASAEERRQLEFALRGALAADEFSLQYQPVVDAASERVVSFEALLRWTRAGHGPVSPAKFVPLAEETRLIVPIGAWVLEQACREAGNWPPDIKVAVNVSPEQLIEPGFAETVATALAASGLQPARLELEVTESIFLRDANIARAALEEVIALGVSVALDDFGTGYSSLGYLRKLRFATIKVDRSFVQGAAHGSPESLAIIRAVVAMADALDMQTTAEGVETAQEAALIRALGCSKIQGYYYSRPVGAEDAAALFKKPRRLTA
ncbi:putative bifunctional diguanylate cyclase/phosphodiesterase [Qipengyuania sp. YIM B01966]|uniref:putative bifunctional diguanylate cyclase/phosphodiesterase n=1 Tax=Qipengyuania sp. YIM B01966 TaxID=2778646 RepID=UPI0018F6E2DE|nr:EAL domain-containing protein [Qipengyuania sp. YIM B01966]